MHSTVRHMRIIAAAVTGTVLITAASILPVQAADRPHLVVGKTFLTPGLDPAEGNAGWALTSHGVSEGLFTVSRGGEIVPALAQSIEQQEDGGWIVTLTQGRSFSDGSAVTAQAVVEALTRTMARNPAARSSAGMLTLTALDDVTVRITAERPTPIMASILAEWPMAIYRMDGDDHIFTGPFAVTDFTPGDRLDLIPNAHYDEESDDRPDLTIRRLSDGQALALALRSGDLDMAFNLPVESLSGLRADPTIEVESFPVEYQYMMWLNTTEAPLDDPSVREAIASAVDRNMLAEAVRAGIPSASAYSSRFAFATDTDIHQSPDPERAAALLDQAGWEPGADGIRQRDGERLSLTLWAYPQRADLITFQPVIRAQLAEIGIDIETRVTEAPGELGAARDFDLMLWAQHTAPAGDPAFFLNLFLRTDGGNNFAGWSNPAFDAHLDALDGTSDRGERTALAREAQEIIQQDVPVIFLMTPEWHTAMNDRLGDYPMWGSDYYVIRPDLLVPDHPAGE
jgi:peptide/nickel transport system substrate-binding protein